MTSYTDSSYTPYFGKTLYSMDSHIDLGKKSLYVPPLK